MTPNKPVLDEPSPSPSREVEEMLWSFTKKTWGHPSSDARKKRLKIALPLAKAQIKALLDKARIDGRIDELESLPIGIDIETGQYRMRYDFTDYYQDRLIQLKRRKKSLLKKRLEK